MDPIYLKRFDPVPYLPAADHGARHSRLILLLPGPDCLHCAEIAAGLISCRKEWDGWGVVPWILHGSPEGFPGLSCRQTPDPEGRLRQQFGGDVAGAVLMTVKAQERLMDGDAQYRVHRVG